MLRKGYEDRATPLALFGRPASRDLVRKLALSQEQIRCAQRETRTPTALRPLPPQSSASTNSAIWAGQAKLQRLAQSLRGTCDSAGTRTQDPLLKRQVLYRLSYGVDPSFKQKVRGKDTRFSWAQGKTRSFWVRPRESRTRYRPGRTGAWVSGAVMSVTWRPAVVHTVSFSG